MLDISLRTGGLVAALALLSVSLLACSDARSAAEERSAEAVVNVAVTIVPQKTFVERIAGERAHVQVLVEPGADPHTFDPTPRQVAELNEADVYFMVGEPFEQARLPRIRAVNDRMRIVDVTEQTVEAAQQRKEREQASLAKHETPVGDHDGCGSCGEECKGCGSCGEECKGCGSCGEECKGCGSCGSAARQPVVLHHCPHCGDQDTHTWVSPRLVAEQAKLIAATLSDLDPDGAEVYEANLAEFLAEIEELDREIQSKLADLESRTFFVYHAAWAYFAADYGLTQVAIEVGGQEPNMGDLARITDLAKEANVRTIFIQPQHDARQAKTIADEIGATVHTIDPLDPDWTANMRRVADALSESLDGQAAQ